MERKPMKYEEKKAERAKDRCDKTVLHSILDDLDTKYSINRDRGDVKTNIRENTKRHLDSEVLDTKIVLQSDPQKTSTPDAKTRKSNLILDSDDSSKRGYLGNTRREESKKLEESRGRTAVKDIHKTKTGNKIQTKTEQATKLKQEIERIDDARIIQENLRIINEKLKRRNEDSKVYDEPKKNDEVRNLRLPPKDLNVVKRALEQRKLLRDRYTLKPNPNKNLNKSKDNLKKNYFETKHDPSTIEKEKSNESPKENVKSTKLTKKHKELAEVQRKPIITTIRKNDHRVYKAVAFIDQKENTPLQIKIPNSKRSAGTNTVKNKLKPTPSKDSVHNTKDKPNTKNTKETKSPKRPLKRRPSSPELPTYHGNPQTEVAKWEPSSITQHTKPYYEAWVDTTLAAIMKCSEMDHLNINKQHFMNSFKKALELNSRPSSPIFVNINDEKYMGKITVNKGKKIKNKYM